MDGLADFVSKVRADLDWLPGWVFSLSVLAIATCLGLVVHFVLVRVVRHVLRRRGETEWRPFVTRASGPARIALIIVALGIAAPMAGLSRGQVGALRHGLLIGFIVVVGWACLIALDLGSTLYTRAFHLEKGDTPDARKHLTQVRILRQALATLIVLLTAAMALMTISGVRQWGVSLLAAGGAASIIVGLALQPLLSNLITGIQLAMTQPIRIGDELIVEGDFGTVEEIKATYVVIRTWDWRRLVVPLTYFNQRPFQNWTRESTSLIGTVMLYVDYSTPVSALRQKLEEIVKADKRWDGQVVNLAVTDFREQSMEVRCLVSARNSGETFDLRCAVREQMIAFLQERYPFALPRTRQQVESWPEPIMDDLGAGPRTGRSNGQDKETPHEPRA